MDITNVRYTEQGSISATIDGQEFSIPDQAGNRHRQMVAEWEEIEGNTIAAYVAPSAPPATDTFLNRVQFLSMLGIVGKTITDVESAIDAAITDQTQNIIAKIKVKESTNYARDNALFTLLGPIMGLSDAEIDAAWAQAVLIK